MAQRRVQFVLCYGHPDVPGRLEEARYPVVRLGTDLVLPVVAPDASGRPRFDLGGSEVVPVLVYSDASGLGGILRARLHEVFTHAAQGGTGPGVSVVFTAHNALLLKTMAVSGRGVAWLPESLITDELACGKLVPAGPDGLQVPVEVRLYRQNAEMVHTAETLWRVVTERSTQG